MEAEETGRTVVRYAFRENPDAIGVEQEIIDAFEAANPDIDIEPIVSAYNDRHARLFTLIAGDTVPDVMRIDSYYMQGFVDAGVLYGLRFALHEPEATRAVQRMADLYQAGLMPQDSITADTGTHQLPSTIRGDRYWNLYADTSRSPLSIREATEAISETYGRGMILRDGVFEIEQLALPAIQRVFIGDISASGAMEEIRPAAQAILDRLQ